VRAPAVDRRDGPPGNHTTIAASLAGSMDVSAGIMLRCWHLRQLHCTGADAPAVPQALQLCAGTAITSWRRGQGRAATQAQQEAESLDTRAACPEYAAVHQQVLQDVLAYLGWISQAFPAGWPYAGAARWRASPRR